MTDEPMRAADISPRADPSPSHEPASSGEPASLGEPTDPGEPTLVIGLTGPIGCGKSTVAGWLSDLGATIVDADVVAREVVEPGEPALDQLLEVFGTDVVAPDGSLDRAALGRIVFRDPEALARLESIVHPAVRPRILDHIADATRDGAPAVIVEAIKLVEGGLAALCDEVWLVVCDTATQRERLTARGAAAADTDARIAAQSDIVDRLLPAATRVIDTSGSEDDTRAAVRAAYDEAVGGSPPARHAAPEA